MTIEHQPSMNRAGHQDDAVRGTTVTVQPYPQTFLADPTDRIAHPHRSTTPAPSSTVERQALLVSARVLMSEALRLLDQGDCSIAGVWLAHAIECLEHQFRSPD